MMTSGSVAPRISVSNSFSVSGHQSADSREHFAEFFLVEFETALDSLRGFQEWAALGVEQKDVRDRSRQGDAAIEDLRWLDHSLIRRAMALADRVAESRRQVPVPQEPRTHFRMIRAERFALMRLQFTMVLLQLTDVAIGFGTAAIECQHADVLQKTRQKQLFEQRLTDRVAKSPAGHRAEKRAAPIVWIVDAVRLAAAQNLHEREAEGEGESRVQAKHHQRLPEIFAAPALCIER